MPSRLERLVAIDAEIRKGDYPDVGRLCRMLEIQPRTLYQDIRDLREKLGLNIEFDRSRGGYHNASPEKCLPSFALTDRELFALVLAKETFCHAGGASFAPDLNVALQKICRNLEGETRQAAEQVGAIVLCMREVGRSIKKDMFFDFYNACRRQQLVELNYDENGRLADYQVEPYLIVYDKHEWYLAVYCQSCAEFCKLGLEKVRQYSVRRDKFEARDRGTFDQWLQTAFS